MKTRYLCCICKKHTKEMLSDIYEIEFDGFGLYKLAYELEELTGIIVDGRTNYVDWVEIK